MENLLANAPALIQMASMALTVVTLLATLIVRITPNKTDDQAVGKFSSMLIKALHFLPTIGINPQTKKLEEEIMQLKESTKV
jgi:ethanolamine ammonia-lyase large subunit